MSGDAPYIREPEWQTGDPPEEGDYLVATDSDWVPYEVAEWCSVSGWCPKSNERVDINVIRWLRIPPYTDKGENDGNVGDAS